MDINLNRTQKWLVFARFFPGFYFVWLSWLCLLNPCHRQNGCHCELHLNNFTIFQKMALSRWTWARLKTSSQRDFISSARKRMAAMKISRNKQINVKEEFLRWHPSAQHRTTQQPANTHRKGEKESERESDLVISICTIIILSGCISIADFYELVSKSLSIACTPYNVFLRAFAKPVQVSLCWTETETEEWMKFRFIRFASENVCFSQFLSPRAISHLLHLFHLTHCNFSMQMPKSALITTLERVYFWVFVPTHCNVVFALRILLALTSSSTEQRVCWSLARRITILFLWIQWRIAIRRWPLLRVFLCILAYVSSDETTASNSLHAF